MLLIIRTFLLLIWGIICSTIGFFISLARPFHPNNSYLFSKIFAPFAQKISGIKVVIKNQETMANNRPAIIVSNHQHNLDLIMGCSAITPYTVSLGKKSLKFLPFFGQFYWLSGNILIDRFNREKAFGTMDEVKKIILKKKISVWIMPEGTRNRTNHLKKFKKGAFITAINAGIPIIPVAVSTFKGHINLNRWQSGTMIIEVMAPIPTMGLSSDKAQVLSDQVHKLLVSKIETLDHKLKASEHNGASAS